MQTSKSLPRRRFLKGGALAATNLFLLEDALPAQVPVAPSDRVRFGMIGIGMQGSGLLRERHQLARH